MAQVIDSAPLNVSLESDGLQPSLVVSGAVNRSNISRLTAILDQLVEEHEQCVSLDMREVESIDIAALSNLADSANAFSGKQKRLHLKEVSCAVSRCLDRHQLSDLFCRECSCGCSPRSCSIAAQACQLDVFTLPSNTTQCHEARCRITRLANNSGFGGSALADVLLAVGEAVANAIKHGHSGSDESSFTVSCLASREKMAISISDSGPGFAMEDLPSFEDALFLEHGRGVHCMNAVMDEVSFSFDGGTTVRMSKRQG